MADLTGRTLGNRYQIVELIGRGGMADVYRILDQQRGVYLAMKVLREDLAEDKVFLRRFKREGQTLSKLQHPNIVRFYGLAEEDGLAFMLMDFIEGSTLRREIHEFKKPFPITRILEIMRPVCAALNYAHSEGVIHCDTKPANIMLHGNGTVLVSDFGIARLTEAATATMVGMGTPAYMAPEQIRSENPLPQTDIYALGVVLYEMLTGGERPFVGEHARTGGTTTAKIHWEHLNLKPPSPRTYNPAIPAAMEAVVMQCLQKDPADRYTGALEFLQAVEAAAGAPVLKPDARLAPAVQPAGQPEPSPEGLPGPARKEQKKALAVISLVTGILGLLSSCLVLLGSWGLACMTIFSLTALVTGILGLRSSSRILAIIGIALSLLTFMFLCGLLALAVFASPQVIDYINGIIEYNFNY